MTYNNGARREHTFQTHVFLIKEIMFKGGVGQSLLQSLWASVTKILTGRPKDKGLTSLLCLPFIIWPTNTEKTGIYTRP